jgi:Spy/CpxP family protein refolding chaperone
VNAVLRARLATILIALVAGFSGVWLGMILLAPPHRPVDLHEVVHRELDLTADQRTRIQSLETAFAARRRTLESEMRAANAELAAAIKQEHGYGPKVTAAVAHFHRAMGELQTETIAHIFAMRAVLTDKQKAKFDDTVVAALTADSQ